LEAVDEFHFIESDLFSYPSNIRLEDQIGLKDFILLMTPILCIGILLFFPFPAFASEKIKKRVKSTSVSDLNEIAKANGFKVLYPSYVREEMASEALKVKSLNKLRKTPIGRRLVEKVEKVVKTSPLFHFKPNFQEKIEKELFLTVGEPIIEKIVTINAINATNKNKILFNKFDNSYLFLFPPAIAILQSVDSEFYQLPNHYQLSEKIRAIRVGALPAVLGWFGQAWGLKKNVEELLGIVRGKKQPKNEKNEPNWTEFFPSESNKSNTNKSEKNLSLFLTQATASGGTFFLVWYFLAIYNKSRREGKKLPVPEFILPDLVPEVRRVTFKEKLYNFAIKLIDLSTPTPYAIILLGTLIYFFVYAGKSNNPVDNAFSFVNTLFQQLVKSTEAAQEYLTEEIKRTNLEAKNAQNELKQEHKLQHEKLTKEHEKVKQELHICQNDIGESVMVNQYSGQVNNNLRSHLQTCERRLAIEEEKNSITSNKINKFKTIIKNEDGSFNEQKFDQLAAEVQDIIHNDIMNTQVLQKVHSRSEDRLLNIDRSLPPFPIKRVERVVEYKTPANQFIDGILNIFGIQTQVSQPTETVLIRRSPTTLTTPTIITTNEHFEHFTEHGSVNSVGSISSKQEDKSEGFKGDIVEGK